MNQRRWDIIFNGKSKRAKKRGILHWGVLNVKEEGKDTSLICYTENVKMLYIREEKRLKPRNIKKYKT